MHHTRFYERELTQRRTLERIAEIEAKIAQLAALGISEDQEDDPEADNIGASTAAAIVNAVRVGLYAFRQR